MTLSPPQIGISGRGFNVTITIISVLEISRTAFMCRRTRTRTPIVEWSDGFSDLPVGRCKVISTTSTKRLILESQSLPGRESGLQ